MRNAHMHPSKKTARLGSALVGLLVVIGLVIVIMLAKTVMKKTAKDPDTCLDLKPWKEWRLRESSAKALGAPSEEQPDITETIRYDFNLSHQNETRGEMYLVIHPDGTVMGAWNGHYHEEKLKLTYDIQDGRFQGYACPLKIYQDANGQDPSKLYFIAKGDFILHEYDLKSKYHIRVGDLYVTGWIEPDYAVNGKLVLTSDEKYFETYEWNVSHPIKK